MEIFSSFNQKITDFNFSCSVVTFSFSVLKNGILSNQSAEEAVQQSECALFGIINKHDR